MIASAADEGTGRLALMRLLQLASPALPVGAYAYSQGLEQAVDAGVVRSSADAERWIGDALAHGLGRWEAPALAAMHRAWERGDTASLAELDAEFVASRETAELRAETLQMGHSLARLLASLDAFIAIPHARERLAALGEPAYPTVWSLAAASFGAPVHAAVQAYAWGWLENQVLAAQKAMALGQSAAQSMLARLAGGIPLIATAALALDRVAFCNWTPGLAIASAAHETQYSRLFRS